MEEDDVCFYCGLPANSIDHVVPQSVLYMLEDTGHSTHGNRVMKVPCCHECNCLLGASCQSTLTERKKSLKDKLRHRYRKYLDLPDWTDQELSELGDHLRKEIFASLAIRDLTRLRIWF
jgi:hypothetical protein